MSTILNFSFKMILATIEAIIGVVKLKTIAWDKGNLWMLKWKIKSKSVSKSDLEKVYNQAKQQLHPKKKKRAAKEWQRSSCFTGELMLSYRTT